jgi:hypothetical protein
VSEQGELHPSVLPHVQQNKERNHKSSPYNTNDIGMALLKHPKFTGGDCK